MQETPSMQPDSRSCSRCGENYSAALPACPHCGELASPLPAPANEVAAPPKKARSGLGCFLMLVAVAVVIWFATTLIGVYSIQPLGALPEGVTVVVWRAQGEPLFNSPDAVCLKAQNGVSLLCRLAAMSQAPKDRIIVRLPYQEWAYLWSTGGITFEK